MGSRTFDGVKFFAYTDDHFPPHVHAFYAEIEEILELIFAEKTVRFAKQKERTRPKNAKRSDNQPHRPHRSQTRQGSGRSLGGSTMSEWKVEITEEDIDSALDAAKELPDRPLALSAEYSRALDLFILRLDHGHRLVIPREQLQGLENATETQLADIEITSGVSIGWRQLDVDHYLPYLLEGRYSTKKWREARQKQGVAA